MKSPMRWRRKKKKECKKKSGSTKVTGTTSETAETSTTHTTTNARSDTMQLKRLSSADDSCCTRESDDGNTASLSYDSTINHHRALDAPGWVSQTSSNSWHENEKSACSSVIGDKFCDFSSDTSQNNRCSKSTASARSGADDIFDVVSKCSSSGTTSSMPSNFTLPLQEVRDAIKYHERLGMALSKLAINPDLECKDSCAYSTNSTPESTLDSNGMGGPNAIARRLGVSVQNKRDGGVSVSDAQNWTGFVVDDASLASSTRTNASKLEEHLSYLEEHMVQKAEAKPDEPDIAPCLPGELSETSRPNDHFFPDYEELISPTNSACGSGVDGVSGGSKRRFSAASFGQLVTSFTPPSTPLCSNISNSKLGSCRLETKPDETESDDDTVHQNDLDEILLCKDEMIESMTRIQDETATIMLEANDNIQKTIENEMEEQCTKLRTTMTEITKCLETKSKEMNKENLQTMRSRRSLSSAPQTPLQDKELLKTIEFSLKSIEKNMLKSISTQMESDACQQRLMISEIVEEKVSKALAGANLEVQLAVQEVKREKGRVAQRALRDKTPPRLVPTGSDKKATNSVRFSPGFSPGLPTSGAKKKDAATWIKHRNSVLGKKSPGNGKKTLEDSFADTEILLDSFVNEMEDMIEGMDKVAGRMQYQESGWEDEQEF